MIGSAPKDAVCSVLPGLQDLCKVETRFVSHIYLMECPKRAAQEDGSTHTTGALQ